MEIDVSELIARCLAGDDVAKAEFILAFGDLIRGAVARALAGMSTHAPVRQDVEDIANDMLVRLLERNCAALESLRERQRIAGWLCVVARNHTIDYVRRWSSRMALQGLVAREAPAAYGVRPDEAMVAGESTQRIRAALAELPDPERLVLELYYTQNMKYAEISAITGQNINTVATRLRRARERLRRLLEAVECREEAQA